MADRLSEPEHNKALRYMSEVLRKGASKVRRYEPPALPLISETLDSLGRGTEGWAYGDKLLGPGVSKPLVTEKTLDMLGAVPVGAPAQMGSAAKAGLYAGALRKDLLHSHATSSKKLMPQGSELPKEFYNLSLGVTKDKPMDFHGSNVVMVPQQGAFDPKTSPSSLSAFDSYTPRYGHSNAGRADEFIGGNGAYEKEQQLNALSDQLSDAWANDEMDTANEILKTMKVVEQLPPSSFTTDGTASLREAARVRNVERFVPQYPKGGQLQEGRGKAPYVADLPRYGQGGYARQAGHKNPDDVIWRQPDAADSLQMLSYGKRFPSFQDYEKSPYGAARLDNPNALSKDEALSEVKQFMGENINDIRKITGMKTLDPYFVTDEIQSNQASQALKMLANQDKKSPKYDPDLEKYAQELIQLLRTTKSNYGELKVFGPTGLHSDNFAGMIADSNLPMKELIRLENAVKKRGLQFEAMPLDKYHPAHRGEAFITAKQMQGESSLPTFRQEFKPEVPVQKKPPSVFDAGVGPEVWNNNKINTLIAKAEKAKSLKDLTDEEVEWLVENDPGHDLFDVEVK